MTDSFWLEDAQIVILTDSPIEGMDMADMANANGHGPSLLLRKSGSLVTLMTEGEVRPRLVIIGRSLTRGETEACISACNASGAAVVLIDNADVGGVVDTALKLSRPFTLDDLQLAFRHAHLSSV
ncbi:hypothetical protein MWU54_05730 [Marivita sp. S6314]|uniref:hypothetical protein n=1 Tax=Marivita sp. S6314 TaxID=2926406 RepID=UPI001FF513D4|nr:hypothetical protein [Marivita sp. S6314]MCK0149513.1 hypothetical protein [Marivita sp. S6314]